MTGLPHDHLPVPQNLFMHTAQDPVLQQRKNWKGNLSLHSRLGKMPERRKSEAGQVHWTAEKGLAHSEIRAGEGK